MVVTVSQNSELTNPEYLFSFVHIFSKERLSFIPLDVSTHKSRYDEFYFVEGSGVGEINFPYSGQYLYTISEQPAGSGNLDPALATNVVENGEAQIIVQSAITQDSQYEIFISNDEFDSNIIFAPNEPNPTPNITPSITPTSASPTPTPTPTLTPTITPSITPTNTTTPTITPTNTITPSITPTLTPTPSSTPTIPYNAFIVGSGSTFGAACSNLALGNTFIVYVNIGGGIGQCAGCFPVVNCFPCIQPTDTYWLDAAFTIPAPDMWLANYIGGNGTTTPSRLEIMNQMNVGGTFSSC